MSEEEKKPNQRIAVKDNKLWVETDFGLVSGWQEVTNFDYVAPEKMLTIWRGGRISWKLWEEICAFMRWTYEKHKAEALITLFYNRTTREWKAWPFPQHPAGMTISYETEHPLYKTDRAQFGKDWEQMGSLHHHCNSGAFQSGTDKSDEEDRDGIHITLGNMASDKLDLHFRQVFDNRQSETTVHQWIELPEWAVNVPINFRYELFVKAVAFAGVIEKGFPPEWRERVIEKKTQARTTSTNSTSTPRSTHVTPNTPSSVGRTGSTGAETSGKEWRQGKRAACRQICNNLKITTTEAYNILTSFTANMSDSDREVRKELLLQMDGVNIPPMWSVDLMEELSDEDIAEEQLAKYSQN